MMRTDPTGYGLYPAGLEEPGCPACATGWHTRCLHPDLADDSDKNKTNDIELVQTQLEQIGPDNVAAIIAEPVIGTGGVIGPAERYRSMTVNWLVANQSLLSGSSKSNTRA